MKRLVVAALVLTAAVVAQGPTWARGGGGCLARGTVVLTLHGPVAIERLRPGDEVWSAAGEGLAVAQVDALFETAPGRYLEIGAGDSVLRVTPEHPLMTAPGEFTLAARVVPGDVLYTGDARRVAPVRVRTVREARAAGPAFNLLVSPGGTFVASGLVVHNKGCFLPDMPVLKADGAESPIRSLEPGDELLAFDLEGRLVRTTVRAIFTREVDEFLRVTTDRTTLEVTAEHPFYVGAGKFREVGVLGRGDTVFAVAGGTLAPQRVVRIERIRARVKVYNLQTDAPNTFFVGGLAVHNKGGGCFPAGTRVETPHGPAPIESLGPGDEVVALTPEGQIVAARVVRLIVGRSPLLRLDTAAGALVTTADHPVALAGGGLGAAGQLGAGDRVLAWAGGRPSARQVQGVAAVVAAGDALVFNLEVSAPHTFVADGFVVHNKGGGGGFHGGGHAGGGGPGGDADPLMLVIVFGTIGAVIYVLIVNQRKQSRAGNLDFVYSRQQIAPKAAKTQALLEFIARQDAAMAPDALRGVAEATFRKLQECWQAREYDPMAPLLMPDLFAQHTSQLGGLRRNHEINRIENLAVQNVDLVNVRYTEKPAQREYTALITARARDYYVDDRTGRFIRGDAAPAQFQEFWTFQRQQDGWLLREIEQAGESDILKDENFAEMLTDDTVQRIYGEAAKRAGAAGPWIDKTTETKATRTERMLNFLVQTDTLWNRQAMLERARQVFTAVYLAQEAGDVARAPAGDLFPEAAAHLVDEIRRRQADGLAIEFRNFCVRKVEVILVRNYRDNSRDEFTVRISAHAQRIVTKGGEVFSSQDDVSPWEEFWTFGRLEQRWKLKEVVPPAGGGRMTGEENVDEDAGAGQLQWYYRQPRAN